MQLQNTFNTLSNLGFLTLESELFEIKDAVLKDLNITDNAKLLTDFLIWLDKNGYELNPKWDEELVNDFLNQNNENS